MIVRTRDNASVEQRIKVIVKDYSKVKVEEIILEEKQYVIEIDEAIDIPFSYYPEKAGNAEFDWISSNPEILRVYNNRFRGLKEGTAEVIVRTRDGSLEERINIIIKDSNKKYVEEIMVEKTEYTVKEDEAVDIEFSFSPIDAINAEFEWYSTNPEILRVYNNRFRGLKKGTAEVVAKTLDGTVEIRISVTIE